MRELAELVLKETASTCQPLPQDDPKSANQIFLCRAKLGWEPKVKLADGLKLTVDFFRRENL
jgi:UDP-glucuronate decarboxylase